MKTIFLFGLFCLEQITASRPLRSPPIEQNVDQQSRRYLQRVMDPQFGLFDQVTVCHRIKDGSFVTETMLGILWWVLVYDGSEGDVGACEDICPCSLDPNSQCSGLPAHSLDYSCSCRAGYEFNPSSELCVLATDFGACGGPQALECENPSLSCVKECEDEEDCFGMCLLPCSTAAGCPHGRLECFDDPRDTCVPADLTSDCPGLCLAIPLTGRVGEVSEDSKAPLPHPFCHTDDSDACSPDSTCVQRPFDSCSTPLGCVGTCKPSCGGPDALQCPGSDMMCILEDSCATGNCTGYCDTAPHLCGGMYDIECLGQDTCTDNPETSCDFLNDPDCAGICATKCGDPNAPSVECPEGMACLGDPADGCQPSFMDGCDGVCLEVGPCGLSEGITCPLGTVCGVNNTCVDDGFPILCGTVPGARECPTDKYCDMESVGKCGPDGCLGVCVDPPKCGGLFDPTCPEGYMCIDDPFSDCKISTNSSCAGQCTKVCDGSGETCSEDTSCIQHPSCIHTGANPCPSLCQAVGPSCGVEGGITDCPGGWFCVEGQCIDPFEPMPCGGNLGFNCPSGFRCANDLASDCRFSFNPSCQGLCVPRCSATNPCPSAAQSCNDDPFDGCDPVNLSEDCTGICQLEKDPVVPCGGPSRIACPVAFTCLDGACQRACAGFLKFRCPENEFCMDDERDRCDPRISGDSCNGICFDAPSVTSFEIIPDPSSSSSVCSLVLGTVLAVWLSFVIT